MSNFTFLQSDWPELYETAREAEQNVNSAPRTGFDSAQPPMNDRRSLGRAVKWLYANDSYLMQPYAGNLAAPIHGFDCFDFAQHKYAQPSIALRRRDETS